MLIQSFPSGPFETNAYVIACPETKQAAIIDPAPESAETIDAYINEYQLEPKLVLLTHSHWDHIVDTAKIKNKFSIPVLIHAQDAPNLQTPGTDGLPTMGLKIEGVRPDKFLEEGDLIKIGTLHFEVIHTPGHTPGGICLYNQDNKILISGDTLFKGSIGNLSLPTANADQMWESLAKLAKLPPETIVYPGHGPPTKIANESWLSNAKKLFGY